MVFKTALMLSLFFIPLVLINLGLVKNVSSLFLLYACCGVGMAGIGMNVMHDAIHGSYSNKKTVNKYVGYTMNLIGASATVWKIQHNVLHHTFTNIKDADDDINTPFFLRFSPRDKRHWMHKFQFIYVWFFYCISTLLWITLKDFVRINRYRKKGLLDKDSTFKRELSKLILWKVLYYTYALILPLIIVPLAPWIIILAFISMHLLTGFLISTVFQIAHIMPNVDFPEPDESGLIMGDWFMHQMATTTNFAPRSSLFSWLIGGLNYQVEHHLLPGVCHIHYKKLSVLVQETAEEFGMPYHSKKTFLGAILDHMRMLYKLGRKDPIVEEESLIKVI